MFAGFISTMSSQRFSVKAHYTSKQHLSFVGSGLQCIANWTGNNLVLIRKESKVNIARARIFNFQNNLGRRRINAFKFKFNRFVHRQKILKLWSVISRCQTFTRRSSAERNVMRSLLTEMELMWYVWALAKTRLGLASTISSVGVKMGTRSVVIVLGSLIVPESSFRL